MKEKKTRDIERSRKEILNAAFLEVYARGFQGVSIDEIVKKTSLTKGAFYHQFPTKLDLGYALVEEVIQPMIIARWIEPLNQFENPLDGILKQMKSLMGDASAAQLRLGCPLNNLVQEMAPVDSGFHRRLKSALNFWVDEMEKQIVRAKKAGYVRAEINAREVAYFVVMAHEGFYGMLKGISDPAIFKSLYHSLEIFFQTIEDKRKR